MGWGESVHFGMLGILLVAEPSQLVEHSAEPDTHTSILIFPTFCLQLFKLKQNTKTVIMGFVFLINTHQNANQKPI